MSGVAMSVRLPHLLLVFVISSGPLTVLAQPRIDPLTGEPFRPRTAQSRTDPEIVNAPHAPLQPPRRSADDPPMEIYVVPQIGVGSGGQPQFNGRR